MAQVRFPNGRKLWDPVLKLNVKFLAFALGSVLGLAVFVATNWLVVKGYAAPGKARMIGPHLHLLSQYFIGYKVTFFGSLFGFGYGFVLGVFSGGVLGWIYNKIVDLRHGG